MKFKRRKSLQEDCWYKADITPSITVGNNTYSDIYVWARSDSISLGTSQVQDIISSAVAGNYRGRGKEQSFNRDIADALRATGGVTVSKITPMTGNPPTTANSLSRTDRGMRIEAHNHLLLTTLSSIKGHSKKSYDKLIKSDCLIHHHNSKREESDNSMLMAIPYSNYSKYELGLAHIGHKLIHTVTNNATSHLTPGTHTFEIHDMTTTPVTIRTVTINIT